VNISQTPRRPATALRWHIPVFLAPAIAVYCAVFLVPLIVTLTQAMYGKAGEFVGLANFSTLLADPRWSVGFWNAFTNNLWFFVIHMLVQNPVGIALAALLSNPRLRFRGFYRTAIFVPTILSFVIVGFVWKLILSPLWGITPGLFTALGVKHWFAYDAWSHISMAVHRNSDDAYLCSPAVDPR
jgi:raffinose/stachyose/melibiose transport system permease protein